jgi:CCR4-NOT transcription complex subunit 1
VSGLRQLVVQYATNPNMRDRSVLQAIRTKLSEAKYESTLVHALLTFIGVRLPAVMKQLGGPQATLVPVTLSLDMLMDLVVNTDSLEGRQAVIDSMVNNLRFPSSRTSLFSIALLFIFAEAPSASVKELVGKTILARLGAERPHPWGLLATMSELVKNPRFGFWKQSFVKDDVEVAARQLALLSLSPSAPEGPSALLKQIVEQQRAK